MKKPKLLVLTTAILALTVPASTIDINDTESLDYWSDSTLDFRVDPDGTIQAQNDLDLNSNNISNYWGNNLCGTDRAVQKIHENGTVECTEQIEFADDIDNLSETLAAGNIANQSIDMDSNPIENIGSTGTNFTDSGNLDLRNPSNTGAELDVGGSANFDSGITSYGAIDVQENAIENIDALQDNSQNTISFDGNNNVDISNGNLTVSENINLTGDGREIYLHSADGTEVPLKAVNTNGGEYGLQTKQLELTDGRFDFQPSSGKAEFRVAGSSTQFNIYNKDESQHYLRINKDGNYDVLIPNGNLDLTSSGNISDINEVQNFFNTACSGNQDVVSGVNKDGSYDCVDADNQVEDVWVNESGDEMDGALNMSNNAVNVIGSGATNITDTGRIELGENIDANSGKLYNQGGTKEISFSGSRISFKGGLDIQSNTRLTDGNNLEFGTDEDYDVKYDEGTGKLVLQNGSTDAFRVDSNENIEIPNGNLDLNDNNISNYWRNNLCGTDRAVKRIHENGTVECTQQIEFSDDIENLSETLTAGNVANQSIFLDDNNLTNPNYVNGIDLDNPGDGIEISSNSLTVSAGNELEFDGSGNLDVDEGQGSDLNADLLDGYNSTYLNTTIDSISNNGQTQTITLSNGDSDTWTDNIEDSDALVGNEIQNLSFTGGDPSGITNSVTHTIEIDGGGNNANINDYFEIDTNASTACESDEFLDGDGDCVNTDNLGTDDQDLLYEKDNQPTDSADTQEIGIENGSNISFQDFYELDDQELTVFNNTGGVNDTIQIDGENNITVWDDVADGDTDPTNEYQDLSQVLSNGTSAGSNNISMNSNSIESINRLYEDGSGSNFFESACNNGQVIEKINSDGTYSCVDPVEDIDTENLSETLSAGSTANQTIFMDGNNLSNPGYVDTVDLDSPGDGIEINSNSLTVSAGNELGFDGSGNLDVDEGQGSDLNADLLDGYNSTYLNTTIDSISNNGQTQTITLSNGDSDTWTDNIEDSDALVGNEIQNLSFSGGSPSGISNSVTHTIEIDGGGDNADINDYYEIDTNASTACGTDKVLNGDGDCVDTGKLGTDNQDLLYEKDNQPTESFDDQEIGIENGSNITFKDFYELDDQQLSVFNDTSGNDDDTIQIDGQNNITVDDDVQDLDADPTNEYQSLSQVLSNGTSAGSHNISMNSNSIEDLNRLYSDTGGSNFFASACKDGQVVEGVTSNGSYSCVDPSEDIEVENLSETLAAGSVANQSIEMSDNNITGIDQLLADSTTSNINLEDDGGVNIPNGGTIVGTDSTTNLDSTPGQQLRVVNEGDFGFMSSFAFVDDADGSESGGLLMGKARGTQENPATVQSGDRLGFFLSGGYDGNNWQHPAGIELNVDDTVSDGSVPTEITFQTGANTGGRTNAIVLSSDQKVDIPNGNLTLSGNNINDVDTLTGDSAAISVRNNLDLQNQNLSNFFGDACSGDSAAVGVYDNGTINCVNTDGFGTDDQTLTVFNNTDGVNDTIEISNGNNVTIRDDVADADSDPTNELQNLSEVLTTGNTANQSINMSANHLFKVGNITTQEKAIQIGDENTFANDSIDAIAIGERASATGEDYQDGMIAIGSDASVDGQAIAIGADTEATSGVSLGYQADSDQSKSTAIGEYSHANGFRAQAIGDSAYAGYRSHAYGFDARSDGLGSLAIGNQAWANSSDEGAVAIGFKSRAPNPYEATFGNLSGAELDLNVTGNATIHGIGGLDMKSNEISNIGNLAGSNIVNTDNLATGAVTNAEIGNNVVNRTQLDGSSCSDNDLLRSDNSNWNCVSQNNVGTDDQDLSEVLVQGDEANQSINMTGNGIQDVGEDNITLGDGNGNINMNDQRILDGGLVQVDNIGVTDSKTDAEDETDGGDLYVKNDVMVDGDIVGGGGADVAEHFQNESKTDPGTVVEISGNMTINKTDSKYDRDVAGVVSTNPAMVMAESRGGVPIAMTGTVPVKVTMENGEIMPGDLLTTASKKGYAMKCGDQELCENAVIGKALQPASEKGKVKMLISRG